MIQRQYKIGPVAPCECGKQPKCYFMPGKRQYLLECAPCGHRTGKRDSLALALLQWKAGERLKLQAVAHG